MNSCKIRKLRFGKLNRIAHWIKIIDRVLAEIGGKYECIGARTARERIVRPSNDDLAGLVGDDHVVASTAVENIGADPALNRRGGSSAEVVLSRARHNDYQGRSGGVSVRVHCGVGKQIKTDAGWERQAFA
jgi:hypothetical protein